jgi:cellulose synthase operon protein C
MTTKAGSTLTIVLAATLAFLPAARGQSKPAGQSTPSELLVQRATALDNQGRHDLAAETWNQVLSIDPKNSQALAALAAYYRSVGDTATAKRYMNQLRQANPQDPHLNQLQTARTEAGDEGALKEAARLAAQHRYAEALALYRQAFNGAPPSGTWAVAYYETEAALPREMPQAVAGLRALVREFPANTSYALSLGRVLTYRPETRLEGVHILENIKGTAAQMNGARDAWRQAILWDPSGPVATETGEQFVSRFNDASVADALRNAPARQPKHVVIEGEAEQGEAYASLSKGDLVEAEKQFMALTKVQAQRGKAYMGLGYIAMQRRQFDVAMQNYELAHQAGLHTSELTDAMNEARFWGSMQKGEQALLAQNGSEALTRFQYASELHPKDPAVLDALGRTWMQMRQPEKAVPLFEQAVKLNEDRPEGWINWFGALAQTGHSREIVADQHYVPSSVSTALAADPEYISILAVAELETGDEQSFRRFLEQLHGSTDTTRRVAGQMRLASLLLSSNPRDAAREALDVIRLSPDNLEAWKLLVIAEHLANRDYMAETAIERMPQQIYAAAQKDTGFAITLASVQQSLRHYGEAADVLESARARAVDDPISLRTIDSQMASLSLQQGHPDKAAQGYSAILQEQPDNADAWAGFISALHQSGQNRLARAQMDLMPPSVVDHLQLDPGYLQVAAAVYTETHELQRALTTLSIVRNYYRDRQMQIPYSVEAQRAWALIALGDDNNIANTLVQLSHRSDLKPVEQLQNRKLWAAWSVRKAMREEKLGNRQRAIAILETASQAYPDSVDIRRALAGTYVRTGNAKSALALYSAIDWFTAGKEDFLGAISAASASRDFSQGRQWLANALQHFPDDPQVLTAAAEFESSAGDMRKAKEYWQAVLNVPAQKLEQQLTETPGGATSVPASEALARMLAPHVSSDAESAPANVTSSSGAASVDSDDVAAMLPASTSDSAWRASFPAPFPERPLRRPLLLLTPAPGSSKRPNPELSLTTAPTAQPTIPWPTRLLPVTIHHRRPQTSPRPSQSPHRSTSRHGCHPSSPSRVANLPQQLSPPRCPRFPSTLQS